MIRESFNMDRKAAFPAALVSLIIFFLPFCEGGARPESLFIVHTLLFILALYAGFQIFRGDRDGFQAPVILAAFAPFLLYYLIRSLLVPYMYAAFLSFWEVLMFCFLFSLVFHFSQRKGLPGTVLLCIFLSALLQAFLAVLFYIRSGFVRTAVFFLNPGHLAAYLSMGFFIGALFFVESLRGGAEDKRRAWWFLPGLAFILAGLIIGSSRGAILSFVLAFAVFPVSFFVKKRKRESIIALLILIIVVLAGAFILYERFHEGADIYRYERLRIWRASMELFLDVPLFGVGPGMFEYHSPNYNFPQLESPIRYGRIFSAPHSDYILILSELGVAGFLLLLIPCIYLLRKIIWKKRGEDTSVERGSSRSVAKMIMACIFIAFLGQSFFDDLSGRPALYMSLAIIVGALIREISEQLPWKLRGANPKRGFLFFLSFILPMIYIYHCAVLSPFASDLFMRKGKWMSAEERTSDALRYYARAISLNPIHAGYFALRGDLRLSMLRNGTLDPGDFSLCNEDLSRASMLNKLDASYLVSRARLYRELFTRGIAFDELHEDAISLYRKAGTLFPKDPFIPHEMASLFYERDELRSAEKECLKSLSIEPCFFQASLLLARTYFKMGENEKARGVIDGMEESFQEIEGYRVKNRYEYDILNYDRERYLELKNDVGRGISGTDALR